jgi:hypothetical protein
MMHKHRTSRAIPISEKGSNMNFMIQPNLCDDVATGERKHEPAKVDGRRPFLAVCGPPVLVGWFSRSWPLPITQLDAFGVILQAAR